MARKYRTGRHLEVPPKNETERTADDFEWLFYLPELESLLPRPVNGRYVAHALKDVADASFSPAPKPHEIRLAWQMLLDVMGPHLFRAFYNLGAWQDFTPYVSSSRDTGSRRVLWSNSVEDVVLLMQYQADEACDLAIRVEDHTF